MSTTHDLFAHAPARTGDRPGGWADVGTKAIEYTAETRMPDGIEIRIHAWLKRHADSVAITWNVSASLDDDAGDPHKRTTAVNVRESGILTGVDEAWLKADFERISRRAAIRCIARVASAWGVEYAQ